MPYGNTDLELRFDLYKTSKLMYFFKMLLKIFYCELRFLLWFFLNYTVQLKHSQRTQRKPYP